jgi:hypothetical protein
MEVYYRLHWTKLRDTYLSKIHFNITSLEKNVVTSPAEPGTKNDCAGEGQRQFTRPDPIISLQNFTVGWLTSLLRIGEVAISVLGPETAYPIEAPAQQATTSPFHTLPNSSFTPLDYWTAVK